VHVHILHHGPLKWCHKVCG